MDYGTRNTSEGETHHLPVTRRGTSSNLLIRKIRKVHQEKDGSLSKKSMSTIRHDSAYKFSVEGVWGPKRQGEGLEVIDGTSEITDTKRV